MKNTMNARATVQGNRIDFHFSVEGPWEEAFKKPGATDWFTKVGNGVTTYFIEYGMDLTDLPAGVAIIPFLCNVLPVAWLYDAEITVDELDARFFDCISDIKAGYQDMYPYHAFRGNLSVGKLCVYKTARKTISPLIFYSGGVDANFSLLSFLEQSPIMTTLWGCDIYFAQEKAWHAVSARHEQLAGRLGIPYEAVKTSFRQFLNNQVLFDRFGGPHKKNWWHGYQHGIGIIGHAAPLAWYFGIDHVVIASSWTHKDGDIKCASMPTIDSYVRFLDARVTHHDYFVSRQEKVRYIVKACEWRGIELNLRVCWESMRPDNCGTCEKCARTWFAIIAEGGSPAALGFGDTLSARNALAEAIRSGSVKVTPYWSELAEKLRHRAKQEDEPHVAALLDLMDGYKDRHKTATGAES